MKHVSFVGRQKELESLHQLLAKKTASLVVIKGRRRIGKSRLIEEFAQGKTFYCFTGLAPTDETTAQNERDEFARQMGEQLGIPGLKAQDWGDLFTLLAKHTAKGRVIILLDEISWMGSKDPTFLSKLKIVWDTLFKKNSQLILILCSSISLWIEKNILSSTGYFGRVSQKITLEELSLGECNALLDKVGYKGSALERFMLLSVTGGVPWYIELINPKLSASENIKQLCFVRDGILVDEYKHIFHDLFGKRGSIYQKIVEYLAKGPAEYKDIVKEINYTSGGPLSDYLNELITSGFISRDFTWSLKTGKDTSESQYRLRDNYLRFYLKYIKPNLNKIKKNQFENISITTLPNFDSIMGFQFENLVLNNRKLIYQQLKLKAEEIIADNPFFQHKTLRQSGCQIDYLIQTKLNTLYVCEIKFSKNKISSDITQEVQEKMNRIVRPKAFACVPILIHINGVSNDVFEKEFFAEVIDFSGFLDNG